MPTAEKFNALGAANGFPFCPDRLDVDSFDYWITLGGFKKGDVGTPTDAQIERSRLNAMRLYWNLYGINYSDNAEFFSFQQSPENSYVGPEEDKAIPKNRICPYELSPFLSPSYGFELRATNGPNNPKDPFFPFTSTVSVYGDYDYKYGNLIRMYYQGSFIGFGIRANFLSMSGQAQTQVGISYYAIDLLSYSDYDPFFPEYQEYDYTELPISGSSETIPFVCSALATQSGGLPNIYDAENRRVRVEVPQDGENLIVDYTVTSVELYEY